MMESKGGAPQESIEPIERVTPDGYVLSIDPQTGEILDILRHESEKPEFHVTDPSGASWVVERMQNAEAQIIAIDALIAARTAELVKEKKRQQRNIEWAKTRWGQEMESLMRLHQKKTGEKKLPLECGGHLQLNPCGGGIEVVDVAKAAVWGGSPDRPEWADNCVRTTVSILVGTLKGHEDELPKDAFKIVEKGFNFDIKTGVK